jgi:hypothetical protein
VDRDQEAQAQIDDLIARYYRAFDNRANRPIDASGLRQLFLDDARITRIAPGQVESWNVGDFIAPRLTLLTDGTLIDFHEWEVQGETTLLGNIAQRRSLYRKSGQMRGEPYSGEGRKLIQLCCTDRQWRIVSVLWEDV